jgi:hypothetical protein
MRLIVFPALLVLFVSCTSPRKLSAVKSDQQDITSLHFIGEYDVPYAKKFRNTTIGGLSGIDYYKANNLYYLISDDRSNVDPARFYTAKIYFNGNGIDSVSFVDVRSLLQSDGKVYPNSKQDPFHTPDPEAIRYNAVTNQVFWTSEGERIVKPNYTVLENPDVTIADTDGKYIDTFALPENLHMRATENGPRQNGVFEGMTFSGDHKYVFVNVEEPIYEDGPRAGLNDSTGWIRINKFDIASKQPVAQYAYQIEPVAYPPSDPGAFKINGVPDILWVGDNKLIVIERSFSTGRLACTIRVFLADLRDATNILNTKSLVTEPAAKPVNKKLLLNMNSLGRYIDNIEGVTFGPVFPNGHRSLIFVSDDNFSGAEKTQFLLFEVEP